MIWLATLLLAGQPASLDCGRYRDDDLQPCEFRRDSQADILDAAGRPPARALGADAVRFSRRPELGGRGLIVEIVRDGTGGAQVRVFALSGHPNDSWRLQDTRRFSLSPERYRDLAGAVDAAVGGRVRPPVDADEQIICMDGPGYLTERVRDGAVLSLAGSCPPNQRNPHPNAIIATQIRDMLCRRRDPAAHRAYWSGRRCYSRPSTMRGD